MTGQRLLSQQSRVTRLRILHIPPQTVSQQVIILSPNAQLKSVPVLVLVAIRMVHEGLSKVVVRYVMGPTV